MKGVIIGIYASSARIFSNMHHPIYAQSHFYLHAKTIAKYYFLMFFIPDNSLRIFSKFSSSLP